MQQGATPHPFLEHITEVSHIDSVADVIWDVKTVSRSNLEISRYRYSKLPIGVGVCGRWKTYHEVKS
jgi:hypothetical protein